jgi:ribonuclease P protein component
MLPKKNRLNIQKHYATLSQQGFKAKSIHLLAYCLQYQGSPVQANVIVPRKITKLKPQRNLLRRRVMHILQDLWPNLQPQIQLLLVINNLAICELKPEELKIEITKLLHHTPCLVTSSPSTKK